MGLFLLLPLCDLRRRGAVQLRDLRLVLYPLNPPSLWPYAIKAPV